MELAKRIGELRRVARWSQEELAEALGVSRQAVSQWETGDGTPDLGNLVRLTKIFGVTLDLLVGADTACGTSTDAHPGDGLGEFLCRAKKVTYAGGGPAGVSSRPGSRDFLYEEGPWVYRDSYFGSDIFAGGETVWFEGTPVWGMNFAGRVVGEGFSGDFHKAALTMGTPEMPFRGPRYYSVGDRSYHCHVEGTLDWFQGFEETWLGDRLVYEARFHGSRLR